MNVIETDCTFLLFDWYRSDGRRFVMVSRNASCLVCGLLQPKERIENNVCMLRRHKMAVIFGTPEVDGEDGKKIMSVNIVTFLRLFQE